MNSPGVLQFRTETMSDKLRRFKFSRDLEPVLLKCVGMNDAHFDTYGESAQRWCGMLEMVLTKKQYKSYVAAKCMEQPKYRSISERFKTMVKVSKAE